MLIAAITAMTIVVTVSAYLYFVHSDRPPRLTETDTIVLADFDNKTGDPVFDDTLRQGLSVELQQSPFLSLISDRQAQQQLVLMGQPKEARLTPELAQQICERTASVMVLEGSIASLGSQYVLGLRARNCNTGNILDSEQIQAAKKEDVLNSLSEIVRKLRTRLGESRATVEQHSTPLADATTPSLEALKAYSTALKVLVSSANVPAAVPFFRRAVEIDPQFAMAYASLGLAYSSVGESVLSAQNTAKAWQLRDRVSDREKFFIDFTYNRQVLGNLEKAYQTLDLWFQTYPRGGSPANPLELLGGLSTNGTGRFEKAIEASQKAMAADPDSGLVYASLAQSYFLTDRFSEAESTLQRASERKLEEPALLTIRYNIANLQGDKDQMDRIMTQAKGKPGLEHTMAHAQALRLARSGQLNWPGSHPAVRWIWPCKKGDARRQRVTRPHERCGKPRAGMLPKRKRTPQRGWRFRRAGMSNTPPALPWLFREAPRNRNRLPMIWKSASRKIRSPNSLTFPFFARYQHWRTGTRRERGAAAHRSAL
jgi:Tfp pilus assembly protein PilF